MPVSDDQIAQRLYEDAKAEAVGMAELAGHADDQKQYTQAEQELLFMREADGWTPEKELALLAQGKTRRQVGAMKYPFRLKLAKSGARALDPYAQARYLADMRQKLDPSWKPTPAEPPLPAAGPEAMGEEVP